MTEGEINYSIQGRWEHASWKFAISDWNPPDENVTAVFGVPLHPGGLVLTKNHRGWELPGGHRELGESIEEALAREILEEAGIRHFTASEKPIGHLEIRDDRPKLNKATGVPYPEPSYILFFAVQTSAQPEEHTGEETLDAGIFPLDNLPTISPGPQIYLQNLLKRISEPPNTTN